MVGRMPLLNATQAAEELVGCVVLESTFNLSVGQIIQPLQQKGTEMNTQLEFSAQPPFTLGGGLFQIG